MRVVVIGAGVIGLTVAVHLQRLGYLVTIIAEHQSPNTTSDKSAAFHFVFHALVNPVHRGLRWTNDSYRAFFKLAQRPKTGVLFVPCAIQFDVPVGTPAWAGSVLGYRRLTGAELFAGRVDGYQFDTALADMSRYLGYLDQTFREQGGCYTQRKVTSFDDAQLAKFDVMINCTGLGAAELVGDSKVFPVRGQIAVLERPTSMKPFVYLSEGDSIGLEYVAVRQHDVVVGGTCEEGVDRVDIDPAQEAAMLQRAYDRFPELRTAHLIGSKVGLRPGRDSVRLEPEELPDGRLLVHSYGHGGAGVTLSWGCAFEVADIVRSLREPPVAEWVAA